MKPDSIIETIKKVIPKDKKTTNLILLLIMLVIILIAMNYIFNEENTVKDVTKNENAHLAVSDNISVVDETKIETRLANILNEIEGVENAKVMLSYSGTEKIIPVYDIKEDINEEKSDDKITKKTVTEKTVAYEDIEGKNVAIVETKETAKINGAIIVASYSDKTLEIKLKEAVSAVTLVPIHKIQVFSKN